MITVNTDLKTFTTGELAQVLWDNDATRRNPQHTAAEYCWSVEVDRRVLAVLIERTDERLVKLNQPTLMPAQKAKRVRKAA